MERYAGAMVKHLDPAISAPDSMKSSPGRWCTRACAPRLRIEVQQGSALVADPESATRRATTEARGTVYTAACPFPRTTGSLSSTRQLLRCLH